MPDTKSNPEADNPQKIDILMKNSPKDAVLNHVKAISPWIGGSHAEFGFAKGGRRAAEAALKHIDPKAYGESRNHLDGAVTRLSPYIRHGVVSLSEVRDLALQKTDPKTAEKFIQQLAWRDYWQRLYYKSPDMIWQDVEEYKTGFSPDHYANDLPDDIRNGETGVAVIDHYLSELIQTGWLHNRARLYIAAYVCHWRAVKWQAGARFFLTHLLDGDPASNNLSWQWVASTFSHKPYYFNLDNVRKFSGDNLDVSEENNAVLIGSYEELYEKLFPNLEPQS